MADNTLDCKGMRCPMPIVQISKMVRKMGAGETLIVDATDGAFETDVYAWAKKTKNEILGFKESDGVKRVKIRKK